MTEELKKEGEASRKKTLHQVKKLLIDGADEEMLDKIRSIIDKEYEKGNFYSKTHIKSVFYRWSRFEFNTFLIKFIEIYKGSVSYWLTDVLNIQEEVSAYCPLEGESLSMTVWCPIINYINGLPSEVSTTGDKK